MKQADIIKCLPLIRSGIVEDRATIERLFIIAGLSRFKLQTKLSLSELQKTIERDYHGLHFPDILLLNRIRELPKDFVTIMDENTIVVHKLPEIEMSENPLKNIEKYFFEYLKQEMDDLDW